MRWERKTLSGPGCWTLAKGFFTFLLCPETLSDAKLKDNHIIILAERSLQGNLTFRLWYGHWWLLLVRFTLRIWKQKADCKDLKNLRDFKSFGLNGLCEVDPKNGVASGDASALERSHYFTSQGWKLCRQPPWQKGGKLWGWIAAALEMMWQCWRCCMCAKRAEGTRRQPVHPVRRKAM